MEFPPEWNILPAEDFEIAVPRDPGEIGVDLMAQIRNNGRILNHFRLVLGGSKLLEAAVPLKNILPTVEALANKQMNSASTRWWEGAGEDGRLHLQLQAIPSPASSHASKPAWKG